MGKIFATIATIALVISACGNAFASAHPYKTRGQHDQSFMPENTLNRYDNASMANITENEFNSILTRIEEIYRPIIAQFGAQLVLERAWNDSTVNAYADQQGSNWIVHMYGGMARRPEMNVAGFALVACHELGHHLGGFPKYSDSNWASNEGNSDYFSTMACGRKALSGLGWGNVPAADLARCDSAWQNQADREACYINLSGGLSLGRLLAVLGGERVPQYNTPDPSVVSKTKDAHPRAQCRTDTYLAGSLCNKSWPDNVIPTDASAACATRPRCWYAPSGDDPTPPPVPPTPPAPDGDQATTDYINQVRAANRRAPYIVDQALICAASDLAFDLGDTGRCSHITSDNRNVNMRALDCGYRGGVNQIVACRYQSPQAAVTAWNRNPYSKPIMLAWYFKRVGCASKNGYYVCVVGNQ